MEQSDIVERLPKVADDIVDTLGKMIGGPLTTREDAVRYVEAYLRETYVAEIERLLHALTKAKEKLKLYRAQHSGEYIGGMEYGMLMDLINEALSYD